MRTPTILLTVIPAAMHLLVDGLCVCCLYLLTVLNGGQIQECAPTAQAERLMGVFLTYNVLAFLTQPFTGIMADRMKRRHWMLLASILILTAGVTATLIAVWQNTPAYGLFAVAPLLGIGNSLFHVWGGKQLALTTGNDIRSLGVFVSTGAMGLALGFVFFSWSLLCVFLVALCLLAVCYLHLDSREKNDVSVAVAKTFPLWIVIAAIAALMGFVMLRSMVGEIFSTEMVKSNRVVLLIGMLAMLGKMAGGWIARAMGIIRSMAVFVVGVAVCIACLKLCLDLSCNVIIWAILAGLFLVNCTMPVTLYLANVMLKGHEGLAFGLLAAALIPGYLFVVCLWI